ncbi:MAG TPA: DnaJ domain-containing protein [Candidatus Obscuribacterales bacterium]
MQELEEDYYAILGVEQGANADDIRKAYLKLAKKLHPDRFPNDPEKKAGAQEKFAKVTRAHEVLGDPRQKEEYDALRLLARSRAALDDGTGGGSATATSAAAAAQSSSGTTDTRENKGEWAARHHARADEYMKRKKFQEAETAAKEAIRLDPTKVKYRIQLAEIYLARGWKTLAMTEIQTALRLDPNNADAKACELRLKSAVKTGEKDRADAKKAAGGGSFLDQLSKLLGKK